MTSEHTRWTRNPTPLDMLEEATEHAAHYYALGRTEGYAAGYRDAEADREERAARALFVRAGVEAIDVARARELADRRPAQGPAQRWAS